MKKLLIIGLLILGTGKIPAQDLYFGDSPEVDQEQQQLEWIFRFSNALGFDINYVSYPELYEAIIPWIGTPYRYSGNDKEGIDCSGFVSKIYAECFHKQLEGSARDFYEDVEPLKKHQLQEGDLVFFRIRKRRISHVGIYLGQNKFIHSSTSSGVIISDLEDPYYAKYFFKGGRVE